MTKCVCGHGENEHYQLTNACFFKENYEPETNQCLCEKFEAEEQILIEGKPATIEGLKKLSNALDASTRKDEGTNSSYLGKTPEVHNNHRRSRPTGKDGSDVNVKDLHRVGAETFTPTTFQSLIAEGDDDKIDKTPDLCTNCGKDKDLGYPHGFGKCMRFICGKNYINFKLGKEYICKKNNMCPNCTKYIRGKNG